MLEHYFLVGMQEADCYFQHDGAPAHYRVLPLGCLKGARVPWKTTIYLWTERLYFCENGNIWSRIVTKCLLQCASNASKVHWTWKNAVRIFLILRYLLRASSFYSWIVRITRRSFYHVNRLILHYSCKMQSFTWKLMISNSWLKSGVIFWPTCIA